MHTKEKKRTKETSRNEIKDCAGGLDHVLFRVAYFLYQSACSLFLSSIPFSILPLP